MAPLTTDRDTPGFAPEIAHLIHGPLAAAVRIRRGAIAMFNGAGYITKGADTAGCRVAGVSVGDYNNASGAAGDVEGDFEEGVFGMDAAAGLAAAARANVGKTVYIVDDHTVGIAADVTHLIPAGTLEEYTNGVYRVRFADRSDATGVAALADAVADQIMGQPEFTVAAEDGDAIAVSVQARDAQGNALAQRCLVTYWLSDAAAGAPSADPPSAGSAVTTGVALKEHTADVLGEAMTDATGLLVVAVSEAAADTWYLNVAIGGRVFSSGAITFV